MVVFTISGFEAEWSCGKRIQVVFDNGNLLKHICKDYNMSPRSEL